MTATTTERRRIVLLGEHGRVDVVIPIDESLDEALRLGGLLTGAVRPLVVDPGGHEVSPATPAAGLVDGGLYTVVDADRRPAAPGRERAASATRIEHGALWWLLGVIGVLLPTAAALGSPDALARAAVSVLVGFAALVVTVVWALRAPARGARDAVVLAAPAALAFASGALAVPAALVDGAQLSVAAGFLAASVLLAVVAVSSRSPELRAASGTATLLLVALAAIWGGTVLVRWDAAAAAAISVGLVPLVLRTLPSTLVNVAEGYFIDYRHFMSNRWTVRGAIPASPGAVRAEAVRRVVGASSARLTAGTLVVSAVAAVLTPFAMLREWPADPFVAGGGIALLACLTISLLLTPRHTTGRLLRWMPRAAAAVVLGVAVVVALSAFGAAAIGLAAALLFLVGVLAAASAVPIARGARSLAWSRTGDAVEWLAVAFALPSALLFADVLTLLRGVMAG